MTQNSSSKSEEHGRRQFLKNIGIGTLGLGAIATLPSVTGLNLQTNALANVQENISIKSKGLNFKGNGSTTPDFRIDSNGNTVIKGDLDLKENEAKNFVFEKRTGDPSSAAVGRIWYRTDLDTA